MRRLWMFLQSILRPVEYSGPLRISTSYRARYRVVDSRDQIVLDTYDEQWARECVEWYNGK